jgi:hypothetical protein
MRGGVALSVTTLSCSHGLKQTNGLGNNKNMVMGPETKNDCAGKDQQQITVPLRNIVNG